MYIKRVPIRKKKKNERISPILYNIYNGLFFFFFFITCCHSKESIAILVQRERVFLYICISIKYLIIVNKKQRNNLVAYNDPKFVMKIFGKEEMKNKKLKK